MMTKARKLSASLSYRVAMRRYSLEPADQPLHHVAPLVLFRVEPCGPLRICAVAFFAMRNQRLGASLADGFALLLAVISFIPGDDVEARPRRARLASFLRAPAALL